MELYGTVYCNFTCKIIFIIRQYEAENEKRKAENRASSIASIVKEPESKEKAWSQIGDFIDFNAQRAAKQTDKDRMKTLLFKLKQSPPISAK